MTPLRLLYPDTPAYTARRTEHHWSAAEREVLNRLRQVAMSCRVAPRTDLFKACALLSAQKALARDAHARALTRCLQQATGVRPVFFIPGEDELSFDEAWILQGVRAVRRSDDDSFAFLITSRIPQKHRRSISFLLRGVAEQFSQD